MLIAKDNSPLNSPIWAEDSEKAQAQEVAPYSPTMFLADSNTSQGLINDKEKLFS